MRGSDRLSIGDIARRTGLSVSAIRFYEEKGLVMADRNTGGQRQFLRSDIRRLSFIQIAQQFGFSLGQIASLLGQLPEGRTPTKRDWTRISKAFRQDLDDRIAMLQRLQDKLDGCIGCGCLSLEKCHLYNPADKAATNGSGARFVLGDDPAVTSSDL